MSGVPVSQAERSGPDPVAVGAAVLMFCLDQLSKFVVTYPLALRERGTIGLTPFFDLSWEENRGVSMNYLRADHDLGRWLLVGFTGLICLGLGVWLWREKRRDLALALGILLGGALGNIADRVRHGFVVDFADLHFGGWRPFLIFNVADAAITIGLLLLIGMSLPPRRHAHG